MAFVPDDAEDRFNELSPSAERFYIYLCRTRNHKTEQCYGNIEACAEKYSWSRATKFAVQKELIEAGWIKKVDGFWVLTVGDFTPVNKSKKSDSIVGESKKIDSESEKSDDQSKNLDSHIRNIPASLPADYQQDKTHTVREAFVVELTEFVQIKKNTLAGLHDYFKWEKNFELAFDKKVTVTDCKRCYDLLEREKILKNGKWQISAQMFSDHILNLKELAAKVAELENGNGQISNPNNRNAPTAKQVEGKQRLDAFIADAKQRFKPPQLN